MAGFDAGAAHGPQAGAHYRGKPPGAGGENLVFFEESSFRASANTACLKSKDG